MSDVIEPLPTQVIIVVGRLLGASTAANYGGWASIFYQQAANGRDNTWQNGPYATLISDETDPNHLKRDLIDTTISDFLDGFEAFKNVVANLPPGQLISIGAGKTITAANLLAKLNSIKEIEVNDKSYAEGYGGHTYADRVEINWKVLQRYTILGAQGVNFLLLHEIGHNTDTGVETRSWMTNKYRDLHPNDVNMTGYKRGNPEFEQQERYTNLIAKTMADSAGIAIPSPQNYPSFPPFGYASGWD